MNSRMNTRNPFDNEAQREWDVQERALRDERGGLAVTSDDAALADYRRIARALRTPLPPVPADFAADVARAAPATPAADGERLERGLLRGLFMLLALSMLAVGGYFGGEWLRALSQLVARTPVNAGHWLLALLACVALSWMLQHLRPSLHAVRPRH